MAPHPGHAMPADKDPVQQEGDCAWQPCNWCASEPIRRRSKPASPATSSPAILRPGCRTISATTTGQFFSGIWESSPGKWRVSYAENEFCGILSGRVVLTGADGKAQEFKAGDAFIIPAGFEGTWETVEPSANGKRSSRRRKRS